jgi:hypothetical protein
VPTADITTVQPDIILPPMVVTGVLLQDIIPLSAADTIQYQPDMPVM